MTEPATLQKNALSLTESTIMGVAGTAPVFSIAATSSTLIVAVGTQAPASLLYCGLIMFGVTFAYMYLNRLDANAGAAYAWVGAIFNRTLGFLSGWMLLVASAEFMVSGTIPAATATLALISPARVNDTGTVTLIAAAWLVVVSVVIIRGIKLTSYAQVAMTLAELAILLVILGAVLIEYSHQPMHIVHWSWFSLTGFTLHRFALGAITALFFFWGWDVTVNLSEETRNGALIASIGSLLAVLVVLILFVVFAVASLIVLPDQQIRNSGTNVVFAIAQKLFPSPWSYIAILAVMLSTLGTLETSILQFTRTLFAYGRDGMLHSRYARLHPTWHTPWIATLVIAVFGLALLFLASFVPTVGQIMQDSVDAIGIQAAFYYSMACFACAWHVWHSQPNTPANLLFLVIWPSLSAFFLWFVIVYSLTTIDLVTSVVGFGSILLGLLFFWFNRSTHAVPVDAP